MSPEEKITFFHHFSTWIGPGGLGIVLVALIAYLTKRYELRSKSEKIADPGLTIQAAFAEHFASERLNTEIAALRGSIEKLAHNINRFCDRIDMVELLKDHDRERNR